MRLRSIVVSSLVALAATALAEEKTVFLKNGLQLTGEIENERSNVITVHTRQGNIRVPSNLIDKIEKTAAAGGAGGAQPPQAVKEPPAARSVAPASTAGPSGPKAPARPAERPATPAGGAAPVTSANPLAAAYAKAAALKGDERHNAVLALAGELAPEAQAEFLAFAPRPPFSPPVQVAIDVFCERPAQARPAALARLKGQNRCAPALFRALERLADKQRTVETALSDRLYMKCLDHAANLEALTGCGTKLSVPAIVDILFFSPEKDGLTFRAQIALREIAAREANPDEALEPLLGNIKAGWPGPDQLVRRRDVLLAMGGSRGRAVGYLGQTLAQLPANDLDPRGNCWLSLARIGTKEATDLLVRGFREGKLADPKLEAKRLDLLVAAVSEAKLAATRPEFLVALVGVHGELQSPAAASALLAACEKITGQRFGGDPEKLRRLAFETLEKTQEKTER